MATVIPLSQSAPASHPSRGEVKLSKRGIPLCGAGVEMASWGSAGEGRSTTDLHLPASGEEALGVPAGPGGFGGLALHGAEAGSFSERRTQR